MTFRSVIEANVPKHKLRLIISSITESFRFLKLFLFDLIKFSSRFFTEQISLHSPPTALANGPNKVERNRMLQKNKIFQRTQLIAHVTNLGTLLTARRFHDGIQTATHTTESITHCRIFIDI